MSAPPPVPLSAHPREGVALAVIVVAQLFGVSLWFSANAAAGDLATAWDLQPADLGTLTSAVQLGFITGTLGVGLSGLADRFRASRTFAVAAVAGALANAGFAFLAQGVTDGAAYRFLTGLCLAGVYPVGMKLIVAWSPRRAGQTLAWLLAMFGLGTALPHLVRAIGGAWPWHMVVLTSSLLALTAAVLVFAVGDRPSLGAARSGPRLQWGAGFRAFRDRTFRASAFGYFGHMWEVYAFWTCVPFLVARALSDDGLAPSMTAVAAWSFAVIGCGAIGSVVGGRLTPALGSARVAAALLFGSGLCCALFPLTAGLSGAVQLAALVVWGGCVLGDSPQFSALSARAGPPEAVGSALALQNSCGFLLSVGSISLATAMYPVMGDKIAWLLLPGPVLGLLAFWPLLRRSRGERG